MALKVLETKAPITSVEATILMKLGFKVLNSKVFFDERMIKADRSSVGKKSRRKGGKFERVIATKFSEWWTNGKDKDAFSKTPRSGAWKFPLDLVPPEFCPFIMSCKNEESWSGIEKTLVNSGHRFLSYWVDIKEKVDKILKSETS